MHALRPRRSGAPPLKRRRHAPRSKGAATRDRREAHRSAQHPPDFTPRQGGCDAFADAAVALRARAAAHERHEVSRDGVDDVADGAGARQLHGAGAFGGGRGAAGRYASGWLAAGRYSSRWLTPGRYSSRWLTPGRYSSRWLTPGRY